MNIFNTGDILQFAMRIEEDGEMFYRKAALNAEAKETRDFFNVMADEEARHKTVFSDMLKGIDVNPPAESYRGEYAAYLRDYIDGRVVFTKKEKDQAMSDSLDVAQAIRFAMGREVDSILYYHEAKQFIDKKHYAEIDKIIEEERKHFHKLADMQKKFK
ncbi:MAG: ferritin family protein [Syntrophorhabdaceae bacterium]|nr:ferritin family protein [Syntrophorhabdaceae bacterium]HOC45955.1 ferritin family protein [Syntrophorhabdaceae bacterium]